MKVFRYILREFKNLFEFYLIPALVIILPHKIYYPIFKIICSHTFFYNLYCKKSYESAKAIKSDIPVKYIWERNTKLLYLIDIADLWLAWLRPKKALKLQNKIGSWELNGGFIALSAHWGTGFISLLDINRTGYNPFFVFTDAKVSFADQGFLEKLYRRIRRFYVNKISGSEAISTGGGGYKAIKNNVEKNGVPVLLFDAPRNLSTSKYFLNILEYKYPIASGFINLICIEKIPFQLFSVKLNFETGYKDLKIEKVSQLIAEDELTDRLSWFMNTLLNKNPEQWYFWIQSPMFLVNNRKFEELKKFKIHVLAYHSANITGNDYNNNDHIALQQDLKLFNEMNVEIISAEILVSWLYGDNELNKNKKYVVLTFDDGNELDFIDWQHPEFGHQISFYNSLAQHPRYSHATAFVIGSQNARETLEKTCLDGNKLLGDKWWQLAESTGLISIENHSWDHLHPTLENVCQSENIKEDFTKIKSFEDAKAQINQTTEYIESIIPDKSVSLFAYPYGHYNDYLTNEYFPKLQNQIKAAFTCDPEPVTKETNRWKIPRYVCGADWTSIDALRKIIS